jgi:hypothetical protein
LRKEVSDILALVSFTPTTPVSAKSLKLDFAMLKLLCTSATAPPGEVTFRSEVCVIPTTQVLIAYRAPAKVPLRLAKTVRNTLTVEPVQSKPPEAVPMPSENVESERISELEVARLRKAAVPV